MLLYWTLPEGSCPLPPAPQVHPTGFVDPADPASGTKVGACWAAH